jgi:hypothetical protein
MHVALVRGTAMVRSLFAFFIFLAGTMPCYAHVKWFSKLAACGGNPLPPQNVFFGNSFVALYALSAAAMLFVFFIDARIARAFPAGRQHPWPSAMLPPGWCASIMRVGIATTFALMPVYFWSSPIILTPELRTTGTWVSFLQLTIAALALFRRTAPVAALGILVLFSYSICCYGVVHLLDYVFFLGIAAYLVISARTNKEHLPLAMAFLRITTGASFLWVSVEKWAYPSWTYEILRFQLKPVLMGFPPEFVVTAAGFVEFCLAFVLVAGRLSSRIAAAVLLMLLMLAIPLVGPIDAIGHFPLIIVLALLAGTRNSIPLINGAGKPVSHGHTPTIFRIGLPRSALYCASVPALIVAYYLANKLV